MGGGRDDVGDTDGTGVDAGGHLTHGAPVNRSGKVYKGVPYFVDEQTEALDYDAIEALALEHRPRIIVAGYSAYPRIIDWRRFREIAGKVGAYLLADIAHISGLVAAGVHPSPIGIADVVSTTTHKSLCGPRGAMLMTHKRDIARKLDRAVFPGEQGGPHPVSYTHLDVYKRQVINRVPHQAAASVEMRAYDPDVFEDGVARMMALSDLCTVRSAADGYPCRVRVKLEGRWQPWPTNARTQGLFDVWAAAAAELGLKPVTAQARGGLSDGNWLWDLLPTLDGLGPEGDNAHSSERSDDGSKDQEYVLASSFVPKALLNIAAIVRLAS